MLVSDAKVVLLLLDDQRAVSCVHKQVLSHMCCTSLVTILVLRPRQVCPRSHAFPYGCWVDRSLLQRLPGSLRSRRSKQHPSEASAVSGYSNTCDVTGDFKISVALSHAQLMGAV